MSLIKKIKQFINGSWQEFQLDANNIDNVATREWVTNAEKTIVGDTTFNGDILFDGGEIRLTNEVILSGSEIYYDGQYVGDFHPNAPYAYANKRWVESLVTNQVQYLGIVNSVDDIINAFYSSDSALGKAGDFVRAGSSFTIETETVHPGDIIIANNVVPYVSLVNYDIIHTEDPGNYVTLNTPQTISASKLFTGEIEEDPATNTGTLISQSMIVIAKAYEDSLWIDNGSIWYNGFGDTPSWRIDPVNGFRIGSATKYKSDYIEKDGYVYAFPEKSGTIALTIDIPDLSNYATLTGENEFTGANSFTGPLQAVGNSYITQYRTDSIFASQFGEEGTTRSHLKYPMGNGILGTEQKIQQGVEGYIATREWAINKFANQIPWSQELIDSCVDLGGWTIKFNTNTNYETDSSKWPVTAWLISSGGYALGVGGPPRVQLKGIDGKQFDTITIAEYIGATQWLLNKLTLPDDFGCITKAVFVSGEPSAEYDAAPIYWDQWEHIMPGGFTKAPQIELPLAKGSVDGALQMSFMENGEEKGSKSYGKYSVALNQSNKAYQRNTFVTGLANIGGYADESVFTNTGITEEYAKYNTNIFLAGQENEANLKGAFVTGYKNNATYNQNTNYELGDYPVIIGGYSNRNASSYSTVISSSGSTISGGKNNVMIAAYNGNIWSAENSIMLGGSNNYIGGKNVLLSGSNNEISTDNVKAFGDYLTAAGSYGNISRMIVGQYNKESPAVFVVANGGIAPNNTVVRNNAFEVYHDGSVQVPKKPTKDWEVVRKEDLNDYITLSGDDIISGNKLFNYIEVAKGPGAPSTTIAFNDEIGDMQIMFSGPNGSTNYRGDGILTFGSTNLLLQFPTINVSGEDKVETLATQEWVQTQGYDAAPAVYTPDSKIENAAIFENVKTKLKIGHLYKVIASHKNGDSVDFRTTFDFIYSGNDTGIVDKVPQVFTYIGSIMDPSNNSIDKTFYPNGLIWIEFITGENGNNNQRLYVKFNLGDQVITLPALDVKIVEVR